MISLIIAINLFENQIRLLGWKKYLVHKKRNFLLKNSKILQVVFLTGYNLYQDLRCFWTSCDYYCESNDILILTIINDPVIILSVLYYLGVLIFIHHLIHIFLFFTLEILNKTDQGIPHNAVQKFEIVKLISFKM